MYWYVHWVLTCACHSYTFATYEDHIPTLVRGKCFESFIWSGVLRYIIWPFHVPSIPGHWAMHTRCVEKKIVIPSTHLYTHFNATGDDNGNNGDYCLINVSCIIVISWGLYTATDTGSCSYHFLLFLLVFLSNKSNKNDEPATGVIATFWGALVVANDCCRGWWLHEYLFDLTYLSDCCYYSLTGVNVDLLQSTIQPMKKWNKETLIVFMHVHKWLRQRQKLLQLLYCLLSSAAATTMDALLQPLVGITDTIKVGLFYFLIGWMVDSIVTEMSSLMKVCWNEILMQLSNVQTCYF